MAKNNNLHKAKSAKSNFYTIKLQKNMFTLFMRELLLKKRMKNMLEDEQIKSIKMCKINSKTSQKRVKIGKKLTPNVNFIHS